jgi:excisionase family DNA binding protein
MGTLLTLKEVAIRLRVKDHTVYYLIRRGDLPVVKLGGKLKSWIKIDEDDLEKYITDNKFRYNSGDGSKG